MSEHVAEIIWRRTTDSFAYEDYNRRHLWRFDAGVDVPPQRPLFAATRTASIPKKLSSPRFQAAIC